jgi:hypothetical protein
MSDGNRENLAAVTELVTTVSAIQRSITAFANEHEEQWRLTAASVTKFANSFFTAAKTAAEYYQANLEPLFRYHAKLARISEAGWLPHPSSPASMIPDENEIDIDDLMERHYRENWLDVKSKFLDGVARCDIDQEAKDTFVEALCAHEQGLFRSTCRTLFPEIERVVRTELLDGSLNSIASMKDLQRVAGQIGLSELRSHRLSGMALYSRLVDHIYVPAHTAEEVAKLSRDRVPNRHAAMHGLVTYKSMQNSINMLIMADFMFHVVSATKANRHRSDGAACQE